jgi:hypothetical protein
MRTSKHLSLNSEIFPKMTPVITPYNNGFLCGEYFSFEIRGCNSQMFFPQIFFDYINKKTNDFNLDFPEDYSQKIFEQDVLLLLRKNRIYQGFTGIVSVFKDDNSQTQILITTEHYASELYNINNDGYLISHLNTPKVPDILLQTKKYPFLNMSYYFGNAISSQDRYLDFIILNNDDNIVKTINFNLFFIKDDKIFYPKHSFDDINNYMTDFLTDFFEKNGFTVEAVSLKTSEIKQLNFEELFLFDIKTGFRWVLGYENRSETTRYYNKKINLLSQELNAFIKQKINYEDKKHKT